MTVYEILFPADEKYKGMVHLAVLNKQKEMKNLGGCFFADLPKRIEEFTILKSRNYYITANAMIPFKRRCMDNLLILSNIVIDFDMHERMNQIQREEITEHLIWRIKRDLFFISEPFGIIVPNVIHRTGRGVQLWFHINSASSKLLWLYQKLIDNLVLILKEFLSEYPELEKYVEIDSAASKNGCGLFRLFDTWNTHTGKKTEIEILHTESIDLNEFFRKLCEHEVIKEKIQKENQNRENYQKKKNNSKSGIRPKRQNNSYDALHRKRLAFIKWWDTQQENSVGKRDIMVYLGYNSAIQIMSQAAAQEWCRDLNAGFSESLKDIRYIFKEIKQPFKITNARFYEMLGAEQEDVQRFEKEYSKQTVNLTRDAERKKRKVEKDDKKDLARKMLKDGYTYQHIADTVGLSVSTIARLSKERENIKTPKEKPWESMGISRATYYRQNKKTDHKS